MEWKTKFEERIASLETKISRLERETEDIDCTSSTLKETIAESIEVIAKLQAEAEVNELIHKLPILTSSIAGHCCNFLSNLNCRLTCHSRMNVIPPFTIFSLHITWDLFQSHLSVLRLL